MNGLGNKLVEIRPLISQAALLIKLDTSNDGSLTIDMPRKLLDSKLQDGTDYKFKIMSDFAIFIEEKIWNWIELAFVSFTFNSERAQMTAAFKPCIS